MLAWIPGLLISCNSANTSLPEDRSQLTAKQNLAAANAVNKAIETGDTSKLGDYIAADGVDHSGSNGEVRGLEKIKAELAGMHKMAANDMKLEIQKEIADSEYVFQWLLLTGTAATTEMGAPVGSKFAVNSVNVTKFANGKATDHWDFMMPNEMMKMMNTPKTSKDK